MAHKKSKNMKNQIHVFFSCLTVNNVDFWLARVCWPLLCLCRPFFFFERCLDSNPGSCRSKQVRYQLGHPSHSLATHFLPGTGPASILWRIFSWSSQRNCSKWAKSPTAWNKKTGIRVVLCVAYKDEILTYVMLGLKTVPTEETRRERHLYISVVDPHWFQCESVTTGLKTLHGYISSLKSSRILTSTRIRIKIFWSTM